MKIYIPSHLKKIKIVEQLSQMIEVYGVLAEEEQSLNKDPYYYYYKQLNYDPVKKFVGLCLSSKISDEVVLENTVNYITHLFYCVKGSLKVFDYIENHLKINLEKTYDANVGNLSIALRDIPLTTDEESFRNAFGDFLKSLLYINNLNISIDSYQLIITKEQSLIVNTLLDTYYSCNLSSNDIIEA